LDDRRGSRASRIHDVLHIGAAGAIGVAANDVGTLRKMRHVPRSMSFEILFERENPLDTILLASFVCTSSQKELDGLMDWLQ
jgi:hypothetical protein